MNPTKRIRTAGWVVGGAEDVLATAGIGSCVALCLWVPSRLEGGMAHMLLPDSKLYSRAPGGEPPSQGIAPDLAVPTLLAALRYEAGLDVRAKLVGAGNMFGDFQEGNHWAEIPAGILRQTKLHLSRWNLPVTSECVGGREGRSVEFDIATGSVLIRTAEGATKWI